MSTLTFLFLLALQFPIIACIVDSSKSTPQVERDQVKSQHIHSRWQNLFQGLFGVHKQSECEVWWDVLQQYYTDPNRHYHTFAHLLEMFKYWDVHRDQFDCPEFIALAIFFHDVIYEPTSALNEELSAEMFQDFAKELQMDSCDMELIKDYILATKAHVQGKPGGDDLDLSFFLDFDLAVLGRPLRDYLQYAQAIRREYSFIPWLKYCSKRAELLRKLLAQPQIFATPALGGKLEAAARENLSIECELLAQGIAPSPDLLHLNKVQEFLFQDASRQNLLKNSQTKSSAHLDLSNPVEIKMYRDIMALNCVKLMFFLADQTGNNLL